MSVRTCSKAIKSLNFIGEIFIKKERFNTLSTISLANQIKIYVFENGLKKCRIVILNKIDDYMIIYAQKLR